MSKNKRIFTILIVVLLILSSITALPSSAAIKDDTDIVSPMYDNVSGVSISLSKANGKIVISIKVTGKTGTTFSNGSVRLFKTSGSNTGLVTRWDRLSSSSSVFTFTDNSMTAESGSYKVNFSIKAVKNGVVESISTSDTV